MAAKLLRAQPDMYSDVVLGYVACSRSEPPEQYISKLLKPTTWGGAMELALFASHYQTEIWCWDIKSGVCHRFGEGQHFRMIWVLAYAGMYVVY